MQAAAAANEAMNQGRREGPTRRPGGGVPQGPVSTVGGSGSGAGPTGTESSLP
jgi:hypothetical protein